MILCRTLKMLWRATFLGVLSLRHPLLRAAHLRQGTGRHCAGGGRVLLSHVPGAGGRAAGCTRTWDTPFYLNAAVLLVGALLVAAVLGEPRRGVTVLLEASS